MDLGTFTEEILNGKLHFLRSEFLRDVLRTAVGRQVGILYQYKRDFMKKGKSVNIVMVEMS